MSLRTLGTLQENRFFSWILVSQASRTWVWHLQLTIFMSAACLDNVSGLEYNILFCFYLSFTAAYFKCQLADLTAWNFFVYFLLSMLFTEHTKQGPTTILGSTVWWFYKVYWRNTLGAILNKPKYVSDFGLFKVATFCFYCSCAHSCHFLS